MSKELENLKKGIIRDTSKANTYAETCKCPLAAKFMATYLKPNMAAFRIAEAATDNVKRKGKL